MSLRLITRFGHPTFADLPWETPLTDWRDLRIVTPVTGLHRHVVSFVAFGDALYAMKELPNDLAVNEYRLLRELDARRVPVVEAVGTVTGRIGADGTPLDQVLITRHLDYALPYRSLFQDGLRQELWSPLLDSLALLLVRIHLAGFFWGDCSLSNALFRRDAGALAATLVDAETGELHDELSIGQRLHDLMLAETNVAGELLDLAAGGGWEDSIDAGDIGADLVRRYNGLWAELTRTQEIHGNQAHVIETRVRRLNELGFDVSEIEIEGFGPDTTLRLRTAVIEAGHHQRELLSLTGLDVHENQARRLLNEIRSFRATNALSEGRHGEGAGLSDHLAAIRWLGEVFQPTIDAIPLTLRHKLQPAELFHQILEHRWYLSEAAGTDVGLEAAVQAYLADILPFAPVEESILPDPEDSFDSI